MMRAFTLLARLKGLRGTAFDPFGRTEERRTERRLIVDYEALIDELIAGLSPRQSRARRRARRLPEQIRGYGHVKLANLATAQARKPNCSPPSAHRRRRTPPPPSNPTFKASFRCR